MNNDVRQETVEDTQHLCPANHHQFADVSGEIIHLNFEKKRKNGEFFNNMEYNEEFRRSLNMEVKPFYQLVSQFRKLKAAFPTRKSLVKWAHKMQREEFMRGM